MGLAPSTARRVLAAVRIVNGLAGLLYPQFVLRRLGTDPRRDRSGMYPFRMFGVRTVLLGADLLSSQADVRRHATRLAVVVHATDTASSLVAAARGDLPRRQAVMTTLISASNTVLALRAGRE